MEYLHAVHLRILHDVCLLPNDSAAAVTDLRGSFDNADTQFCAVYLCQRVYQIQSIFTHPSGTWIAALKAPTVIQPVFNIFLTLPFGFYMKYYFQRSWKQTILLTFCLSLFFELTQLSGLYGFYPRPYRLFDVDDLLLNTTGGIVGAAGQSGWLLPANQGTSYQADNGAQ